MPESMGQRIEARLLDGRGNLRTLCGNGLGRQAPGDSHAVRVIALDGDKWKVRPDGNYARKGGNGLGVSEAEVMYTLTTADRHVVAVVNDKAAKTERNRQNG